MSPKSLMPGSAPRRVRLLLTTCAGALCLVALSPGAFAQGAAAADQAAAEPAAEPLDNQTPRGAVVAYLAACRSADFELAARYLDLANVSDEVAAVGGPALARQLKVVLDRRLWIEPQTLSADPGGDPDDGLPEGVDEVGTIVLPDERRVSVLVARPEGRESEGWLIASSTVERVPYLFEELGYGALGEMLPPPFFEMRLFEIELWQWIGLLLFALLAWFASWVIVAVFYRVMRPVVARTATRLDDRALKITASPLRLAAALALFSVASLLLYLNLPVQRALTGLLKGLAIVALCWLVLRLLDMGAGVITERFQEEGREAAVAAVPLGRRTLKIVVIVIGVVAMLQNLGFNVTGLIAGLGVGGLAIALAAQKTIENFFGGVALIGDQPVRVGDTCRFGDKVGTIEDIGIWSTRVRTLDRTVVTVPNGQFAAQALEDFSARDTIRIHAILNLRYETTGDQLRYVLAGLRRLLAAHPMIAPQPQRVRFIGFGASSLDVEVQAFVTTTDWSEFLAVREDVWLRVMDVVEQSGSGFAFPSQTAYVRRDPGLDEEKARAAEREVGRWREEGALPFPDLPPAVAESIDDSLDWPPDGSPPRPLKEPL